MPKRHVIHFLLECLQALKQVSSSLPVVEQCDEVRDLLQRQVELEEEAEDSPAQTPAPPPAPPQMQQPWHR